jgi:Protein phosphatase 2C
MADVIALSMAGQSHLRVGRPNQDSGGVWSCSELRPHSRPQLVGSAASRVGHDVLGSLLTGDGAAAAPRFVVMAVSDGHGSDTYDRSDRGSAFAVELMLGAAARAAHRLSDPSSGLTEWLQHEVPRRLIQQWRKLVLDDAATDAADAGTERPVPAEIVRRYGATLVGAVLTQRGSVFWQIGDGDLVIVNADGSCRTPNADEAQLGTATDSLCEAGAEQRFRVAVELGEDHTDSLVFMSTDGVANSFVDDDAFLQFVEGIAEMARDDRRRILQRKLEGWLARCSSFSGDDVTAVIRCPRQDPTTRGGIGVGSH